MIRAHQILLNKGNPDEFVINQTPASERSNYDKHP